MVLLNVKDFIYRPVWLSFFWCSLCQHRLAGVLIPWSAKLWPVRLHARPVVFILSLAKGAHWQIHKIVAKCTVTPVKST